MKQLKIASIVLAFGATALVFATETDEELKIYDSNRHIEDVLRVVDDYYVYPATAKAMRLFVSKRVADGHYQEVGTLKNLIVKLQADLRSVSKDGHLSLHLAKESTDRTSQVRPLTEPDREVQVERIASGLDKKKIGYLGLNTFSGDDDIRAQLTAAMNALRDTDGLIIDLRQNSGGDPDTAVFLSSHFISEATPLWSIVDRDGKAIYEAISITSAFQYEGELCILISEKTYSAAEAFTYTLKHLNRASIIGEPSGGGAHLVEMERVNDDLDIRIPVVRAYNPITKSNWEGHGVIPTIRVIASDAKPAAIDYLRDGE